MGAHVSEKALAADKPEIDGSYFVEEGSAEIVNSRMGDAANPRLRDVLGAITRNLHAAVKEVEPTHEEWLLRSNS